MDYREIFEQTKIAYPQQKKWIYSQYKLNGSKTKYDYHIESYQNNKRIGWWYGEAIEDEFITAFGWRYKLFKHFRKRCNENIEKD